jgi:hypothetical protein
MFSRSLVASAVAVVLSACGPQTAEVGDTDGDVSADESFALSTTELKVATTGITVWLRPYAVKAERDGQTFWVLRGRTSVNLDHAMSFVPDDPFCATTVLSARTFEIACHGASETNSLLSGLPLFVNLVQPGPKQATLKFVLEPRFVDATGSTRVWLNTELKPIYVSGVGLTYRGKLRATGAVAGVVGGTAAKLTRRGTTNEMNVDVSFEQVAAAAAGSGAQFTLDLEGVPYTKKAMVAFGVKELDLQRTPDAYETWPSLFCSSAVQACLNAAGGDAYDYEACGSYRQVTRCNIPSTLPQIGLSTDDRSLLDARDEESEGDGLLGAGLQWRPAHDRAGGQGVAAVGADGHHPRGRADPRPAEPGSRRVRGACGRAGDSEDGAAAELQSDAADVAADHVGGAVLHHRGASDGGAADRHRELRSAADVGLDPGEQLGEAKRFLQPVGGPGLGGTALGVRRGRDDDQRGLEPVALVKLLGKLPAAHHRHAHVEHDRVGQPLLDHLEGELSIRRFTNVVATG